MGGEKGARSGGRLFVAVVTALSATMLIVAVAGSREVFSMIASSSPMWVSMCLFSALLVLLVDALRILVLSGMKVSLWRGIKASIYGFYVSAITPFSSGGQPFQIYYLTKLGLPVEEASMVVGVKFMMSFTISVVWGGLALLRAGREISSTPYIGRLIYVGVSLTLAFYAFFFLLAVGGRFGKWFLSSPLISGAVAFFLRKERSEVVDVVEEKVEAYRKAILELWRESKWVFLLSFALSFLMIFLILASPYFAVRAVGGKVPFLRSVELMAAMSMVFYFVPTPGASGGVEGVFYLVFSGLTNPKTAASALLIWRLFSYHLSIALGAILSAGYVLKGAE